MPGSRTRSLLRPRRNTGNEKPTKPIAESTDTKKPSKPVRDRPYSKESTHVDNNKNRALTHTITVSSITNAGKAGCRRPNLEFLFLKKLELELYMT